MVELKCEAAAGRPYVRAIRRDACAVLEMLELYRAEVSILITDDTRIMELNRAYRGKEKPTDVLSFPQHEQILPNPMNPAACDMDEESPPIALGDIVISIETALRQADALAISPEERLQMLLTHGLLHLIGFDHERSPAEARRMFARERELRAQLLSVRFGSRDRKRAPRPLVRREPDALRRRRPTN